MVVTRIFLDWEGVLSPNVLPVDQARDLPAGVVWTDVARPAMDPIRGFLPDRRVRYAALLYPGAVDFVRWLGESCSQLVLLSAVPYDVLEGLAGSAGIFSAPVRDCLELPTAELRKAAAVEVFEQEHPDATWLWIEDCLTPQETAWLWSHRGRGRFLRACPSRDDPIEYLRQKTSRVMARGA